MSLTGGIYVYIGDLSPRVEEVGNQWPLLATILAPSLVRFEKINGFLLLAAVFVIQGAFHLEKVINVATVHQNFDIRGFYDDLEEYPLITYYWTVPLILDHSYLAGKLTSLKIADTKVSGF